MIRCVVFDFDGTLVDSNRIKHSAYFEVADGFTQGGMVMERILQDAENRDRYWVFGKFAAIMSGGLVADDLAASYTRICRERIAQAPEIDGASASLERLRRDGIRLFLSSATPRGPLMDIVSLRGMDRYFEAIYGSPASKHENLVAILATNGFTPNEVVVVGDGDSDWASADSTGCRFVAVQNEYNDFTRQSACRIADLTRLHAAIAGFSDGDTPSADAPAVTYGRTL